MAQAQELLMAGVKVIDLAADFRMQDVAQFEKWYGIPHTCPDVLSEAVYGLPELNRDAIKTARVIGNPGCYPTTMQLGFYPLLKAGIVDATDLIADCKSGVSGAGRKAEIGILFSEASDTFKAYGVSGHRHTPETVEQLQRMTEQKVGLLFTPHLVPMIRGMHSTLYARLNTDISNDELQALFENTYKDEPFVDVMPFGSHPETRSTRASNMLRIALHRPNNGKTVIVLVVQDNLVKGASGQAVQCMNLMFGLDEVTGLQHIPVLP
jgi:N-acetyl-gamma-glutamyl-phosphate reductase